MQTKRTTLEEKCRWMRARQEGRRLNEAPAVTPLNIRRDRKPGRFQYGKGKQCNPLTREDAAYIAGFFDGEGCICVHRRANVNRRRMLEMIVAINNTNEEIIL